MGRKGVTPIEWSEEEHRELMALAQGHQIPDKQDRKAVADSLNEQFHSGAAVRTGNAVYARLYKQAKEKKEKSSPPNSFAGLTHQLHEIKKALAACCEIVKVVEADYLECRTMLKKLKDLREAADRYAGRT